MNRVEYDEFIAIINQREVLGELAVRANELLCNLQKSDLREENFELIEGWLAVDRTSMPEENEKHILSMLAYVRGED